MSIIAETAPVLTAENFAQVARRITDPMKVGDLMRMQDKLPCAVANCAGHGGAELLDTWEELTHVVQSATLPTPEIGLSGYNEGNISLNRRDGEEIVYYYSLFDGELRVDQLDDLIAQLNETVTEVESFKMTAETRTDE